MMFMNGYEIEDARARWRDHPVLGPATRTLANLRDYADETSDGWAYWPKPCRAAKKLQELIQGEAGFTRYDDEREDATPAALKQAYAPIKAFRTKQGARFEIEEES
jgi:hypothetical protein